MVLRKAGFPAWRAIVSTALLHSRYGRIGFGLLPLLYMVIIFSLSAMPGGSVHVTISDKILHTVEYAGLSFFLYLSFHFGLGLRSNRSAWCAVLVSVLYGAGDELHQSFVPGRDMSILDWYADLTGALLAQAGLYILRTGWRRKSLSI